jgi:hypothetical protein
VSTTSTEKYNANFIPHTAGRFRLDIKFNGEKVPQSPLFVEVSLTFIAKLVTFAIAIGTYG